MKKVISVRFKDNGKTYYFDPADTPIKTGDYVIVETARGVECGEVVQGVKEIADSAVPKALKPITRMADSVDVRRMRQNREDEKRGRGLDARQNLRRQRRPERRPPAAAGLCGKPSALFRRPGGDRP